MHVEELVPPAGKGLGVSAPHEIVRAAAERELVPAKPLTSVDNFRVFVNKFRLVTVKVPVPDPPGLKGAGLAPVTS